MNPEKPADKPLPLWQSALLAHGCQVTSNGQHVDVELQPLGDQIVCTPSVNGWMLPFHVRVKVGTAVTITWDSELSRYIVSAAGKPIAA
jgi:hypothetical protein